MTNPFVGEIRIFPFGWAPSGWAQCNGQIIPLGQNTMLFSLIGTTFGGNGTTNFALPNLQGRVPIEQGNGASLTPRIMGDQGGTESVTLDANTAPPHNHGLQAINHPAELNSPGGNAMARSAPGLLYTEPGQAGTPQQMSSGVVGPTTGNQAHNNLMPFLTLSFCIALVGVYPSRS